MQIAQRGGTETAWRQWGDLRGDQPKTLMIHCSLGHSGAWKGLFAALDRPAIAFDLPGHGQSGPLKMGYDFHRQCTDVAVDFLSDNGPMDVIGHSFGATIALRLAVENPDLVRRVVLIEPVFFAACEGTPEFTEHQAEFAPFIDALEAGEPMRAAEFFTARWGVGVPWDQMKSAHKQGLADRIHIIPAEDGFVFQDNANLLKPGRLEAVTTPVLFVQGETTEPIIGAVHEALMARIPNTQSAVIKGAGHMAPITHPVEVAAEILDFLKS